MTGKPLPRGKFDGVDTLPMFDEPERSPRRPRLVGPRSVAFASCPSCTAERVGLVRAAAHLVWRTHQRKTYSGATLPCRANGVPVCVHPPATATDATTCPCQKPAYRLGSNDYRNR